MRSKEETQQFVANVAKLKGWIVNPDKEFTQTIVNGLTKNENELGYYLCPCRETSGTLEKDRDIHCPCDYAKKDIEEHGQCYCALFLSPEMAASGKEPNSIPERRPPEKQA